MSARLARTADGWWAVATQAGPYRLGLAAATTAGLPADRGRPASGHQGRAGRQMSRDAQPLLTVTGLSKTLPGLRALDGVDSPSVRVRRRTTWPVWSFTRPAPAGPGGPPAPARC